MTPQIAIGRKRPSGADRVMTSSSTFGEILDAVDGLGVDDQMALVDIVRRRLSALRREEILEDVRESRREHAEGRSRVGTPEEIMAEILS